MSLFRGFYLQHESDLGRAFDFLCIFGRLITAASLLRMYNCVTKNYPSLPKTWVALIFLSQFALHPFRELLMAAPSGTKEMILKLIPRINIELKHP